MRMYIHTEVGSHGLQYISVVRLYTYMYGRMYENIIVCIYLRCTSIKLTVQMIACESLCSICWCIMHEHEHSFRTLRIVTERLQACKMYRPLYVYAYMCACKCS